MNREQKSPRAGETANAGGKNVVSESIQREAAWRQCGYCGQDITGTVYRLMPQGTIRLCQICKVITDRVFQSPSIDWREGIR